MSKKKTFNSERFVDTKIEGTELENVEFDDKENKRKDKKTISSTVFMDGAAPKSNTYNIDNYGKYERQLGEGFDIQENIYQHGSLEEAAAQNQSGASKLVNAVPRIASTAVFSTLEGIGSLGGMVDWLGHGAKKEDLADFTNNTFSNAMHEADQHIKENWVPVHVRSEIENGSFGRQLWSPEFWAKDFADGLGTMAGFMLTGGGMGAALKGLNMGAKATRAVSVAGQSLLKLQWKQVV